MNALPRLFIVFLSNLLSAAQRSAKTSPPRTGASQTRPPHRVRPAGGFHSNNLGLSR